MQVYKFGGASVATADGIKNVCSIILKENERPIVVISAMGKMTNAFEILLEGFLASNRDTVDSSLDAIESYHKGVITDLGLESHPQFDRFINELEQRLKTEVDERGYDYWYDQIVSYGEMLSTSLVSDYLESIDIKSNLIDSRTTIITDSCFRSADIDFLQSQKRLKRAIKTNKINILQGFISGDIEGNTTTLGREGSDYSAAAIGNMLNCKDVTIWKDVEGVLNADPRLFKDTVLIPRLSYVDAVELAFSGAQIIHPKTIKPLQNKNIPLHVRSFLNPEGEGSIIQDTDKAPIDVPIIIIRKNQVLLSLRPKDFSFVLEECLQELFTVLNRYHQKVNIVQASAVRISVSIDKTPHFQTLLEELSTRYKAKYNDNLELVTIRGNYDKVREQLSHDHSVFIKQETRRTLRLLRKPESL